MTVESPVGRWRVCLTLLCALAALLVPATRANASVGYQVASIPVASGKPVPVAIWYPSAATPAERAVGPFKQTVATNAPVTGRRLPLIIVSHGTGGSKEGHWDTALALAGSGFVVAAIEHTGDNYRDQSRATDVGNRPLELRRLPLAQGQRIDLLLTMPASGGAFPVTAQREGDRGESSDISRDIAAAESWGGTARLVCVMEGHRSCEGEGISHSAGGESEM